MTIQDLQQKLKELRQEHELKQKEIMRQYCDSNNPYQIGDKFTDHIGSIIVEKIRYSYTVTGEPCCVYFGTELKKDGTLKKNDVKRQAWQPNDVTLST
jgi:hypothetical protein